LLSKIDKALLPHIPKPLLYYTNPLICCRWICLWKFKWVYFQRFSSLF